VAGIKAAWAQADSLARILTRHDAPGSVRFEEQRFDSSWGGTTADVASRIFMTLGSGSISVIT
jgi:hypothetical protein